MKALWTPWRMEHVRGTAPEPPHCLFEPEGDHPHSRETLLLFRDNERLCLLNRYPYANGHLLIAPVRHVHCITDLASAELTAVNDLLQRATGILKKELGPDGFNIGLNLGHVAGAGIDDHLHYHIVPRWQDDHNYMTVLAEIRAIPEHIEKTFDRLLPHFQRLHRTNHSR
ncbi:MAG: HIT domain-containing protein [Desulfofustis sp.]|nr:HIT domain-containing protein [Desulfofustis sp.]NNK12895.1 HIT domain-containing protein [Desulfofustis sp.]